LTRSEQCLERLRELVTILTASQASTARGKAIGAWADFARAAYLAENRRNSLSHYMSQLSRLLAVRVTENAARSGEHYICETRSDYGQMWRSAAGAGVLIGGMALLKIFAAGLHAPLIVEAFLFSMIYGLGFVTIYLLGMTVATKQPAMTAQTLAGLLGDVRATRQAELERLVDVVAAVCRSQLAAIAGNVMVALPVAILLGLGLSQWLGQPVIALEKGAHLLADLDPLGWALPHAAIAGFFLFLSGLITGYFDNQAAYSDVGARIARLHWLRGLLGGARAARVGAYIQDHLGGIMGNFLFGCMLGATGDIGKMIGLPLDIRHIAFASANLGYAFIGFQFELPLKVILWAVLGIALIGLTNLAVSFALALRTALRARGIRFEHWGALLNAIWRRFRHEPRSFLLPPRAVATNGQG
jgi:site-specific recombinase